MAESSVIDISDDEDFSQEEFIITKKNTSDLEKRLGWLKKVYEVTINFGNEVHDDATNQTQQWISLQGDRDMNQQAKKYIIALCNAQETVTVSVPPDMAKRLLRSRVYERFEKEYGTAILVADTGQVEIRGADPLSTTLAVSAIEDLLSRYLEESQTPGTSQVVSGASSRLDDEIRKLGAESDYQYDDDDLLHMSSAVKRTMIKVHLNESPSTLGLRKTKKAKPNDANPETNSSDDVRKRLVPPKATNFKEQIRILAINKGYTDKEIDEVKRMFGDIKNDEEFFHALRMNKANKKEQPQKKNNANASNLPDHPLEEIIKHSPQVKRNQTESGGATSGDASELLPYWEKLSQAFNEEENGASLDEIKQRNMHRRETLAKLLQKEKESVVDQEKNEQSQEEKGKKKKKKKKKKSRFNDASDDSAGSGHSPPNAIDLTNDIGLQSGAGNEAQQASIPAAEAVRHRVLKDTTVATNNGVSKRRSISPIQYPMDTDNSPPTEYTRGKRYIVIDGSNVAMAHGNDKVFSCRGIKIAVDYFKARGHTEITAFVPKWRSQAASTSGYPIIDRHILEELKDQRYLVFTPSRRVPGKNIAAHDDKYIMDLAVHTEGVIVSNDNFRDLFEENHRWRKAIMERLLQFSIIGNLFMPPDDPLGRDGPTLDEFLRKPATREEARIYEQKVQAGLNRAGSRNWNPKPWQQSMNANLPNRHSASFTGHPHVPYQYNHMQARWNPYSFPHPQSSLLGAPLQAAPSQHPGPLLHRVSGQPQPSRAPHQSSSASHVSSQPSAAASPRPHHITKELERTLLLIFPDDAKKISKVLVQHPHETDANRLSEYML